MKFAIVDIETTGLYHQGHGITEIAILHLDEDEIKLAFHSLVKPNANISGYISELTGIDGKMVEFAPELDSLISEIKAALDDRVFVAHNVNFDYQFLKAAFDQNNIPFHYHRFCTMRYSRKVLPELQSHRLGLVLKHLGIENNDEHRAAGDAWATAELLVRLREMDMQNHFESLIKQNRHHSVLPPNISEQDISSLPSSHGVYFFYNQQKKPIYIGKAKNLKRRVLSHFTSSGSSRRKMIFQREVYRIEFQRTRSEYESLLIEDASIRKYWPRYNRAQKERTQKFTVVPYTNRNDDTRLAILKTKQKTRFPSFTSYNQAKVWLYRVLLEWEINPEIAGLAKPEDFDLVTTPKKIDEFICTNHLEISGTFLLLEEDADESLAFAIIDGKYAGYGPFKKSIDSIDAWIDQCLNRAEESSTAQNIINQMLNDENVMKYEFKD